MATCTLISPVKKWLCAPLKDIDSHGLPEWGGTPIHDAAAVEWHGSTVCNPLEMQNYTICIMHQHWAVPGNKSTSTEWFSTPRSNVPKLPFGLLHRTCLTHDHVKSPTPLEEQKCMVYCMLCECGSVYIGRCGDNWRHTSQSTRRLSQMPTQEMPL